MNSMYPSGTAAIVSDGAGVLGEAAVRRLHGLGVAAVIADLMDDRARTLVDRPCDSVVYVRTDLTDSDSVSAALDCASHLDTLRSAVIAHGGLGVGERLVRQDGSPAALEIGGERTLQKFRKHPLCQSNSDHRPSSPIAFSACRPTTTSTEKSFASTAVSALLHADRCREP